MSTCTKPGSYALNLFTGVLGPSSLGSKALRLATPWRRRQRSRAEREASGWMNSRVTTSRSSSGSSNVLRNSTTTTSWAGVRVVCKRWGVWGAIGNPVTALPAANGILTDVKFFGELCDRPIWFPDETANLRGRGGIGMQANVHCASSGADVDTSNSITSLARNNDSILDPIQSSGTQQVGLCR